jgi:hypothetical protein
MQLPEWANETQHQLPLAKASFDCKPDEEVTLSDVPERPARLLAKAAWLGLFLELAFAPSPLIERNISIWIANAP